ncbi:MAG: NAD(P)H-dependent oxidoreductase [Rhizobiaceae bacterium]|nr:NAD(P)H-dependent oxidoreductase [Rhizobiaceae bacterium]MCV0407926.1 NAD(P)H-dependent oxidoreductase [Rhizobiaceae bacterium]
MLDTPGVFTTASRKAPASLQPGPHIVGIGGTTRIGSSSEAALRCALASAEMLGATTELFCGPLLDLPMYDPSNEHRSLSARRLVQSLRRADGVIIATPSYHGALSGVIKNALDYTEDMRDDPRPYLEGRGVGVIVTAFGSQALGTTLVGVRSIVHALRGWPTPFAAALNSQDRPFMDGRPSNADIAAQFDLVASQVVQFAAINARIGDMGDQAPLKAAAG